MKATLVFSVFALISASSAFIVPPAGRSFGSCPDGRPTHAQDAANTAHNSKVQQVRRVPVRNRSQQQQQQQQQQQRQQQQRQQQQQQQKSRIECNIINRRGLFHAAAAAAATSLLGPKVVLAADEDIEAKSPFIEFAKNFVRDDETTSSSKRSDSSTPSPLDKIAWDGPKKRGLNMEQMADAINDGLVEREWFVTGRGKPEFFSNDFVFTDPQVSLVGFESYCRGVRRLFDQDTARCELVCCSVTAPNTITVLWRNSGRVNLGPLQIELKPYAVTTTLKTNPDDGNLIASQVDEFEADTLGLLLYQISVLRPLAGPPAPSVDVLKQQCDFYSCKLSV